MISHSYPGGGLGQDPSPVLKPGSAAVTDAPLQHFDTGNNFMVLPQAETLVILNAPKRAITRLEALNLAAWLVAIATVIDARSQKDFEIMLREVKNT